MNETPNLSNMPYFLIAAYYLVMLRLWLSTPPSTDGGGWRQQGRCPRQTEKCPRSALQQISSPLANDNRVSRQPVGSRVTCRGT